MSLIKRNDLFADEVFSSLDELEKRLGGIIATAKKVNTGGGGAKDVKDLSLAEQELAKVKKQLEVQQARQNDEYIEQVKQLKAAQAATKELTAAENRELGTLEKLAKENKSLTEERKKLNLETENGKKRLTAINAELDRNNKKIRESSDALTKQKINIGNYQSALSDLSPTFAAMNANLMGMVRGLKALVPVTNANTTALGRLRVALIATGIGAIVAILGTLIAAFLSTERGMDSLMSVIRPLQVIFKKLLGVIQDLSLKAFDGLKEAINNPKEALKELGEVIKNNIINRFKSLQVFGESISLLMKGEWSASAKKFADGWIQATTGIEDGTDKLSNAAKGIGDFIGQAVDEGQKLFELEEKLEDRQIALEVPLKKLRLEMEKYQSIATDNLATNEERIAAIEMEKNIRRQILAGELELKDLEIEILKLKQSFNDVSAEDQLELQKLIGERYVFEQEALKEINKLNKKQSTLQEESIKARMAEMQKILDLEINAKTEIKDLDEKVTKNYLSELDKRVKATTEAAEAEKQAKIKAEEEAKALREKILKESAQTATEIFSGFTDIRQQQISDELNAIEHARDRELQAAEGNARQQNEINKKYDRESRKLKREQVKLERADALFKVIINTATAIAEASPNPVLIALAAALGAAQAAAVLAAPIPKFDSGTERTPDTYIAGEKRPELRKSKGKWQLVDKPTLFTGSAGDKIVSGKQTDSILGNLMDIAGEDILTDKRKLLGLLNNEYRPQSQPENLGYILKQNNEDLIRTILNKKEVNVQVRNAKVTEKSGNITINRIDFYYGR